MLIHHLHSIPFHSLPPSLPSSSSSSTFSFSFHFCAPPNSPQTRRDHPTPTTPPRFVRSLARSLFRLFVRSLVTVSLRFCYVVPADPVAPLSFFHCLLCAINLVPLSLSLCRSHYCLLARLIIVVRNSLSRTVPPTGFAFSLRPDIRPHSRWQSHPLTLTLLIRDPLPLVDTALAKLNTRWFLSR